MSSLMSSVLELYVKKWSDTRENASEETIDKVLMAAKNGLETILTDSKEAARCLLRISYKSSGKEIEVDAFKDNSHLIFKENIALESVNVNLTYILTRIKTEFEAFPQLQVERVDFANPSFTHGFGYYIEISLK